MGLLVDELVLLARLDQQRPLAQSPVDLLTVVADAVEAARATAPTRHITLDVGNTDPPPVVLGDQARLRQVLDNLLSNALRHTPADTPVNVSIATRANSDDIGARRVVIDVIDSGPGMTEQDAARVFERFYRADPSRSRNDGGTGLGLAIVAALVARHGGGVTVTTAPGAGARFRVELPLAEQVAATAPRPAGAGIEPVRLGSPVR
jgi:two-component system OmpR family sensor kinase